MLDLLAFGDSRFELITESVLRWLSCYFRTRLLELYDGKPNRWTGEHVIDKEKLAKYLEQQKQ